MTTERSPVHTLATSGGTDFQDRFGWKLPRVYTDVASEYQAAAEGVAVHDSSYAGRLKASGDDALDLLNRMSTNLVLRLEPGQGAPTILTTDRGRILDLVGVANVGAYILLLTSPDGQQRVIDWLDKYTIMEDLTVEDITPETTQLTVLGPQSGSTLEAITGASLAALTSFHSQPAQIGEHPVQIISRPLGDLPSFDLLLTPDAAAEVWDTLVAAGIVPMGSDAYEALRIKNAVPKYGQEMGEAYNPLETGLIGSIDFAKGCYIGQEVIARLDTYKKVQKYLVQLRFSIDAVVSEGANLEQEGRSVGKVTSLTSVPTTGELVGLGYVRTARAKVGSRLELPAPAQGWAEVTALPQLFGPGE
ncbi:MAG: aminomethyltransferase family protein [Dehalococcoidia bacterium]